MFCYPVQPIDQFDLDVQPQIIFIYLPFIARKVMSWQRGGGGGGGGEGCAKKNEMKAKKMTLKFYRSSSFYVPPPPSLYLPITLSPQSLYSPNHFIPPPITLSPLPITLSPPTPNHFMSPPPMNFSSSQENRLHYINEHSFRFCMSETVRDATM